MSGHFGGWQNYELSRPPFAPPPFDFSRPPPPIPRLIPPPFFRPPTFQAWQQEQKIVSEEQKPESEDQSWVQQWLANRVTSESNCTNSLEKIKISDVKRKVEYWSAVIEELETLSAEENLTTEQILKISTLKAEASEISLYLETNKPVIANLIEKRAKKREKEKTKRAKAKLAKEKLVSNRQAKHRQIDAWRQEQQEEVERAKREEETRKQADAVLCEVRSKQSDGKSLMQVLESLKKLRRFRAQTAADKKMYPSEEENERFDSILEKLGDLWQLQLDEYAKEEQTLRVMMDEEKVIRRQKQEPSAFETNLELWLRTLFGRGSDCTSDYEHFFHLSAEKDPNTLISVRQCWDQFLAPAGSPMASSLPVGWVVPCKPSSADWETLLESRQK
ncbi:programmed cell death protein 7-like [Neocloeon triangulifer]|uniref:programmed cell death protein 7-like n=1 Tax=Neocloeon triangulifer TaxID=2078957 RepID=UPI00286F5C42|nr:programmed cell death protein 7-like [Neocloeon triangulifer]